MLFFEDCPNLELATNRARQAIETIESAGGSAELHLVRIEGEQDAFARGFLGSPTIRVDGLDVEPSASGRLDFGVRCRLYHVDGQIEGAPPVAWIEAALRGEDIASTGVRATGDCCSVDVKHEA